MIRLAILNFGFCCFLAWAWWLGYVGFVFTHDISHLSYLISGVFLVSIARLLWGKSDHLLEAKEQLTGLGLIGTLIGFVLAMYGLSQTGFGNPEALSKALAIAGRVVGGEGLDELDGFVDDERIRCVVAPQQLENGQP